MEMLHNLKRASFTMNTQGSALNCHKTCICASNIVSCSKMNLTTVPTWTPIKLPKLHNLLLSHNGLHFLSSEAFVNVKYVRYLDLSSNNLQQLDEVIFEPLVNLQVLLLYHNQISQIDRSAFVTMGNLQKLYLSQNQISRFPLELVKEKTRLEKLSLLDVSSNKIKILPIDELQVLPAWIKNGLYFHNNPLLCHCDLYTLLAHWYIRKLNSAVDFKDDYTCILPGPQKTKAFLEQTLTLGCDTKHRDMLKTWTMPGNVQVTPGSNQTAKVLQDGSLRISPVKAEDSGTYTCFATSEGFNETIYVVVLTVFLYNPMLLIILHFVCHRATVSCFNIQSLDINVYFLSGMGFSFLLKEDYFTLDSAEEFGSTENMFECVSRTA
uniref:Adhesion molecule with Ig like domain 1 n=1 Tax=Seriola dumerili TaxID=41447 RepID=A0A3B4U006_SERDU